MRRDSDFRHGQRTGAGRRARDRMLAAQGKAGKALQRRPELASLTDVILFLDDDLRESAIAVGGIEAFLLEAQRILEKPDLAPAEITRLLEEARIGERIELLEDALASLRRSMTLICATLK